MFKHFTLPTASRFHTLVHSCSRATLILLMIVQIAVVKAEVIVGVETEYLAASETISPLPPLEQEGDIIEAAPVKELDGTNTSNSNTSTSTSDAISDTEPNEVSEESGTSEAEVTSATKTTTDTDSTLQPSLTILDTIVAPGSAEILTWKMESSFQDVAAPVSVFAINGTQAGPTLCLTAAIHGDELNGIEVVRRVVNDIDAQKISGAVIAVPIVNIEGFKRANRYLPDRRDLNRYFPGQANGSYASRIAHSFFTEVIRHCDYLLDLHTGSMSRTNLPQIRANLSDPAVAEFAEKMGSIVILQSSGGIGTLRRAATDIGIPAVTFEAGAPNNLQKEAVEQGAATVFSILTALGITSKARRQRNAEPTFYRSKWVRAREGGILYSKVELGDNVKKGSVLGLLSNPINNTSEEIRSPIEGRVIGMALNQVMYPGFAAYHIGLKSSMVEAAHPVDEVTGESFDYDMFESDNDESPILNYGDDNADDNEPINAEGQDTNANKEPVGLTPGTETDIDPDNIDLEPFTTE